MSSLTSDLPSVIGGQIRRPEVGIARDVPDIRTPAPRNLGCRRSMPPMTEGEAGPLLPESQPADHSGSTTDGSGTVSVVVAIYNVEAYLGACLTSLVDQTYRDIEVILVDDGSSDRSGAMCDVLAAKDSRVRVIHRRNGGLSAARNSGLEVARGSRIVFVDGDDWLERDWIERLVSVVAIQDADVVVAGAIVDQESQGDLLSSRTLLPSSAYLVAGSPRRIPSDPATVSLLGYAWNKLYCLRLLRHHQLRFTEGLRLVEDVDFNARVFQVAQSISLVEFAGVHYMQRDIQTLGRRYHLDHVELRSHALKCIRGIFEVWSPSTDLSSTMARLERGLVNSALRNAAATREGFRSLPFNDGDTLSELLDRVTQDPDARRAEQLGARMWRRGHRRRAQALGAALLLASRARGNRTRERRATPQEV